MIAHRLRDCSPYPYSNDQWNYKIVDELNNRLGQVRTPTDRSVALVIGAGSLPYTLDRMPKKIIAADRHPTIPSLLAERCVAVTQCSSWGGYMQTQNWGLAGLEHDTALRSGLAGDYNSVKDAARSADIRPLVGNVVAKTSGLARSLRRGNLELTFINFTNVAAYLASLDRFGRPVKRSGHAVLARTLNQLPVSDTVVICDSHDTTGMKPAIYSPQQYIDRFGSADHPAWFNLSPLERLSACMRETRAMRKLDFS